MLHFFLLRSLKVAFSYWAHTLPSFQLPFVASTVLPGPSAS